MSVDGIYKGVCQGVSSGGGDLIQRGVGGVSLNDLEYVAFETLMGCAERLDGKFRGEWDERVVGLRGHASSGVDGDRC